jgi:hypothetical protein
MKSQIDVNNNSRLVVPRGTVAPSGVPKRRDRLAEAVRLEIVRLMAHHNEMEQIELARRAGERQQRVHKFVNGQMPYPPLEFMDRLFRVFGHTLIDGLRGSVQPVTQLPILRPDVQAVADLCAGMDAEGVKVVQSWVTFLRRNAPTKGKPDAGPRGHVANRPHTNAKRDTPKRKA